MCSMTLEQIDVRDTGLYFAEDAWSPFVKIGTTFAVRYFTGTRGLPVECSEYQSKLICFLQD